jgi:hypothetical protein
MSTSTATVLTGRTMPTRYPDKPCRYCGITPTALAHLEGTTWYSVCADCASSHTAQTMALLGRAEALAEVLTGEALAAYTATCEAMGNGIATALASGHDAACKPVVPGLLLLLAQHAPAPVRPNRYAKPCGRCGIVVPVGEGRIEHNGAWMTFHVGDCPVPAAAAPAAPAAPLAATEADRTIRNKRAGKCAACGLKVAAGEGWAMQGLPGVSGWAVLHGDCADSLAADRHAVDVLLPMLGDRVKALTGTDTRDHGIRVAVPFTVAEGDGQQPLVFLRACWGAQPVVEVHTGAPGDVHRSPLGARRAAAIVRNLLGLSDADLSKAQADYGRKMQACGRCGSPLTDADSRAAGLGPECAKHA